MAVEPVDLARVALTRLGLVGKSNERDRRPTEEELAALIAYFDANDRITMPMSMVRLSAGRESMSDSTQALCFMAGANSIFTGDKLLTTGNAGDDKDAALFTRLGMRPMQGEVKVELEAAE